MSDVPYLTKEPMTLKQFDEKIIEKGWRRRVSQAQNLYDAKYGNITGIAKVKSVKNENHVLFFAHHTQNVEELLQVVDAIHDDDEEFWEILGEDF